MSEFEGKMKMRGRERILARRKWTWFSGKCGCGEYLEKLHS
jgi:hypothetical protein